MGQKLIMFICALFFSGCGFYKGDVFILKNKYRGVCLIMLNQTNGEEEKYENGSRIFIIPENGILKTKFQLRSGWSTPDSYFFYGCS
jgi:hypothetical protein